MEWQGEELEPARKKAEAAGVKEIFIDDVREEFVREYVFPMFRCAELLSGSSGMCCDQHLVLLHHVLFCCNSGKSCAHSECIIERTVYY